MKLALALTMISASISPAADLALVGGTVYMAPDVAPIRHATVVIHDGKITAVGESAAAPKDAKVVDCSGKFVMAGFWNSHVHIFTPELLHTSVSSAAELNTALDAMLNKWGFTTVFDIASLLDNTLELRRRIDSGEVRGPHLLTTGEPLWTKAPVYVKDYLQANHIAIPVVTSPEDASARVRAEMQRGVNGIKLFTGSVQAEGAVANMPLDMVRAACAEAHSHHLPVFAHPQNTEGLEVAINGGVDILAHTAPQSPPWTRTFVSRLKGAHMALIPTLTLFDSEARKAEVSDEERQQWIAKVSDELRAYSQSGGEVLFGTDVGYIDHFDTALEYRLLARAGMSFTQILASLTTAPAHRFGFSDHRGRIAKGMDADITVLQGDPAKDVTAFSQVQMTIRGGQVIYSAN